MLIGSTLKEADSAVPQPQADPKTLEAMSTLCEVLDSQVESPLAHALHLAAGYFDDLSLK